MLHIFKIFFEKSVCEGCRTVNTRSGSPRRFSAILKEGLSLVTLKLTSDFMYTPGITGANLESFGGGFGYFLGIFWKSVSVTWWTISDVPGRCWST